MTPIIPRPSVSLIATVLNEAESLGALLASVDGQTLQPDEVVFVDGGSSDGTREVLEAWARGRDGAFVVSQPGSNIAQGRNRAIATAGGEIIAVTDGGVVLDPCWLERLVGALAADPEVAVASGFFEPEWRNTFELAMAATVLPIRTDIDPTRFLPSSRSVAFRRTAWEQVGAYPEWLDYCEDLVFDLALQRAGLRFVWVPEAVVRFRPRGSLGAFFRQYYRYARGDGKADLRRSRHALRYGAYALLPLLAWRGRSNPLMLAGLAAGGLLYLRRPVQRLIEMRSMEFGARNSDVCDSSFRIPHSAFLRAVALIPLIRLVGDVAKMAGYPVGLAWRARRGWGLGVRDPELGERGSRGQPPTPKTQNPGEPPIPGSQLAPASCDLSVIVVNYNTRDLLRVCLESLHRSVGVDGMETFVVDNASDDASADMVASEFPWVKLIRSPVNGGYAYANNLALGQAGGRRVLLLNPDTEVGPSAIANMLAYLEAHADTAAVGPKLVRPDGSLDLAARRSFPTPAVAFYRLAGLSRLFPRSKRFGRYNLTYLDPDVETEVDALTGAFMLVRREAIEDVGLLDERFFMYGEDLDWAYRMHERRWRVRYNPGVVVLHHKGESSRQVSTHATMEFYRAMRLFYDKHYRAGTPVALGWLIHAGINLRLAWSLFKNRTRPASQRRVST